MNSEMYPFHLPLQSPSNRRNRSTENEVLCKVFQYAHLMNSLAITPIPTAPELARPNVIAELIYKARSADWSVWLPVVFES